MSESLLINLAKLAAFVAVTYVVWRMLTRPRHAVSIVIDKNGIKHHRGLPKGQEARVLGFLEEQLAPQGKITINADRQPEGHLRLYFTGPIDPGAQQQVRNFLNSVM